MNDIFSKSLELVFEHEGGYSIDPQDPGGETKYGISKRAHPEVDILNLSKEHAGQIYRNEYWDKIRGDFLPPQIAPMVFDFAVNAGVSRAVKFMQEVAGVKADGIIGNKTLDALFDMNVNEFLINYASRRMEYYKSLKTFKVYGKGWLARTNKTLKYCQSIKQMGE